MDRKNFRIAEWLAARFTGTATDEDERELREWEGEDERRRRFVGRVLDRENFERNEKELAHYPSGEAWERVKVRLGADGRRTEMWRWMVRCAAVLVLLLAGGVVWWWLGTDEEETVRPTRYKIMAGGTGARLTTGDGEVIDIVAGQCFEQRETDGTLVKADSAGIIYRSDTTGRDTTVWNTMETLTGMEYTLALADGSRVYMNAETRITFPVDFRGVERRVRLEGEAYFEVAKDASKPFVVETGDVEVRVLGTEFNVRAYKGEREVAATLVEGRVAVSDSVTHRVIAPGEQAVCGRDGGGIEVRKVDVSLYTAWKSGKFVFRNETLGDVMAYLSRWYGFRYRFVDERVAGVRIGASMDRYAEMTPIIEMMRRTGLVNVTQVDDMLYISSAK